ncbi:MAG TPA: HTH domain-containing protein [Woeseiaceae bacterium]|nr:HTH domain-containing protein [Woeseiaceae bacterium]
MESSTINAFGGRQRQLLTLLLESKKGLGVDDLADALKISRSAVHQHLTALERDGYVDKEVRASSGGRPGNTWYLNERGVHLFPKQYALFSDLLIQSLKDKLGSEELIAMLRNLGENLAKDQASNLHGKSVKEQIESVAEIMREFGYQARTVPDPEAELPLIDARNCIYHHLAREHSEVCELDLALLSTLLDADIEHVECMVRGGSACRFRVLKQTDPAG